MKREFIPNSYQTPNDYADQLMHLLTGEEWKVLSYTIRRIIGFWKSQDNISLSQYQEGKRDEEGGALDHGTGLSKAALLRALGELTKFGLMLLVAENDPVLNEGDCYALQLDPSKVDVEGLERRAAAKRERDTARTLNARAARADRRSVRQTAQQPANGLTDRPPPLSVGQTAPRLSDRPPPVCATDDPRSVGQTHNNQRENQEENQGKHTHTAEPQGEPPLKPGERVCACGLVVSLELLKRYVANHPHLGTGYINSALQTCNGHELIRDWLERVDGPANARVPAADAADCPDCRGTGMYYPEGLDKGVAKCRHPRLVGVAGVGT